MHHNLLVLKTRHHFIYIRTFNRFALKYMLYMLPNVLKVGSINYNKQQREYNKLYKGAPKLNNYLDLKFTI